MRIWTAHAAAPVRLTTAEPVAPELVPEGFGWGAFLLPGLWFAMQGMWLAALAQLAANLAVMLLAPAAIGFWALLALQVLAGFEARDLQRWSLSRRGRPVLAVVVGRNEDAALLRLLGARPELVRAGTL
jgi:signal transduction histidine kinase